MKAINLIPLDERKGGAGAAARSGGAVYFLLGGLGLVLLVVAAFALVSKQVADREERLATVQAEVNDVRAQAAALKPYGDFARLAAERVSTVQTLAGSRVDWRRVLDELARAIPADVHLTKLDAVKAGEAAAGGAAPGAAAAAGPPKLTLDGCAPDQEVVARMLVKLGQLSGAGDVDVTKSVKPRGPSSNDAECGLPYAFTATVAFGPEGSAPAPAAGAAAATPPASAPAASQGAGEGEVQNTAPPEGGDAPATPASTGTTGEGTP